MHVKSLKVFCDVAGRQSFSRAADENGISQSGASQMVQHLEERLGVTLIDRSKRPLVLTPEGEVFYRGCRKLVRDYSALEDEVRTLHQDVEGLVRVACIYSVGLSHMNHYVQDFQDRHPKANVRVEYEHPDKVYELVEHDQVDLGLVSYPQSSRSVQATAWRNEPMVLVCAPGHTLSGRASIGPQQLDGVKMVGFDEGLRIRRAIDRVLTAHGAEARVVMEFDNIETIKRAIEIDAGVGILPLPTVTREIEAGTLVAAGDSFASSGPHSRSLTIGLALEAAETGHVVFGTLHTSSAAKTVDRIVDVFPAAEKEMVRAMLSESLKAVISQTLLKKIGGGRVAAHEIMIGTPAIRNLIREAKVAQMYNAIQTGSAIGMQTLDQNLQELIDKGIISKDDARSKAANKENFS